MKIEVSYEELVDGLAFGNAEGQIENLVEYKDHFWVVVDYNHATSIATLELVDAPEDEEGEAAC